MTHEPEPPPQWVIDAILEGGVTVTAHADIYEENAKTLWMPNAPLKSGGISVDQARDERRNLDIEFKNDEGALKHYPGGFWYDKVIKTYRGVEAWVDGVRQEWETQVGEFLIDGIREPNFPKVITCTGRDRTKVLLEDKLAYPIAFTKNMAPEDVIRAIAENGNISGDRMILPNTGKTLGKKYTFEAGLSRWEAIKKIALDFNYEVYFDQFGWFVMSKQHDPAKRQDTFTFKTGGNDGSLISFEKVSDESNLYNAVAVRGEASDTIPVAYVAVNRSPNSPTSVQNLKRQKTYEHTSPLITTEEQASELAWTLLAVMALETFEINMQSLVFPWLEAGSIIKFIDPDPNPGDPTRFLLSNFSFPLGLGPQTTVGKRITVVG